MISLRLFGGISIERSDGAVAGPAAQRLRLALLALLALHRDAGLSRDKLLVYLWPDTDAERGRHLLSNALYGLRQGLGRDVLVAAGDALRLRPEAVRVDVHEFLDALERDEPELAIELYAGPFLDGFFLSEAPEFEEWVEAERDRLARRFAAALEAVAERCEAAREFRRATECWSRLAARDPLNSRITLRLMRSLVAAGHPAAALQQARVHETLLREELDIDPDAEIAALVEQLQSARLRPAGAANGGARPTGDVPHGVPGDAPGVPPASAGPGAAEPPSSGAAASALVAADRPQPADPGPGPAGAPAESVPRRAASMVLAAMLVVALVIAAVLYAERRPGAADSATIRSLAVLPLENCTPDPARPDRPDPEQEFFAAGLTDALIMALARIEGLRVTSRTSVMRYKAQCGERAERDITLARIARDLDVDAIVEGMVIRSGDRVRINAQLVAAATDEHLWADAIDRDFRDVLALQDDVVGAVAGAIRLRAVLADTPAPAPRRIDPAAYTHYLQGRYLWNEHQLASHQEALQHFEQALAIDSSFAPAWSGLADIYVHLDEWDGRPERGEHDRGMVAARRALELDGRLAEAHASLAHLLMHEERWAEAERAYRRALELDPSNANARILYAFYLSAWERHDEAIHNAVRALEVDPLASRTHSFAGFTFYFARRYDAAIAQWQRLIELYPDVPYVYLDIAMAHAYQGRVEEGMNSARRGLALADSARLARVALARLLAVAGRRREAEDTARAALRDAPVEELDPLIVAQTHAALGDPDEAFRWLEVARAGNHGWLMFLRVEPGYDPLRADPRFAEWVRTMKLD